MTSLKISKNIAYIYFLRFCYRLAKYLRRLFHLEKNIYVWQRTDYYKKIWEQAAISLSASFSELAEGFWKVKYNNQETIIHNHHVQIDDFVTLQLAGNKPLSYKLFSNDNFSIPEYRVFNLGSLKSVMSFIQNHKGPFVIKPARDTSAGMGVSTHIRTYRECLNAIALASLYGNQFIIEKLIPGECYRMLYLDYVMINASRRTGLRVVGDGISSIDDLVKNAIHRTKQSNIKSIEDDRDYAATLKFQKLTRQTILERGTEKLVKSINLINYNRKELRTTYDTDVTDEICKNIKQMGTLICERFQTRFTGIDIITIDPSVPLSKNGGVINEINTTPGLHHHKTLVNSSDKGAETIPTTVLKSIFQHKLNN